MFKEILSGGFLRGRRSYVLGAVMALQALGSWAVGDLSLAGLIEQTPEILGGLSIMTVRAGIANALANVAREAAKDVS